MRRLAVFKFRAGPTSGCERSERVRWPQERSLSLELLTARVDWDPDPVDLRSKLLQTSKDQSFLRKDSLIAFRYPHRTDTAPLKDTSTPPPLLTLSPQTHPAPALP
ncbi:unnamed protein product [Boreogadus saida]